MGPTPRYHPLKGEGCETSVEHEVTSPGRTQWRVLLAATEPFSHMGEPLCGAHKRGPWVGEPKPQGKTPLRGNLSPDMTYLPPFFEMVRDSEK